jgi:NAD(P)-dependent dehydrogenase (short-subunit alcohol dehydrogenase family)
MGTYAISGSASGMGRETAHRLRVAGHTVIGVDIKDADVTADLSAPHGRQEAADAVLAASGSKLDGAVLGSSASDRPSQLPGRG